MQLFNFKFLLIFIVFYANASGQYIPCDSWISFCFDDSNTLASSDFNTQMNFISSTIGIFNHPESIQAIGMYSEAAAWNSGLSIQQIQDSINSMPQTTNAYSLLQQFASLSTKVDSLGNLTIPVGALVFISDTSDAALANANNLLSRLSHIRLTFILLGPNVDSNKLMPFSDNFINWTDLSQLRPDNWGNASLAAYGCNASFPISPPTMPSTSTTYSTTPPTASSSPSLGNNYVPCQSWISFSFDDSDNLDGTDYMTQINFIASAIGNITHPERLQAIGVSSHLVPWNSDYTIQQIQNNITSILQEGGPYDLSAQFSKLVTGLFNLENTTIPIGAVIFISDTSDAALVGANQFINRLSNILLTFVLLGSNVNQSKLTQFSSNFILWTNLSQPQPSNWNFNTSFAAYGCNVSFPISPQPSFSTFGTTLLVLPSILPTQDPLGCYTVSSAFNLIGNLNNYTGIAWVALANQTLFSYVTGNDFVVSRDICVQLDFGNDSTNIGTNNCTHYHAPMDGDVTVNLVLCGDPNVALGNITGIDFENSQFWYEPVFWNCTDSFYFNCTPPGYTPSPSSLLSTISTQTPTFTTIGPPLNCNSISQPFNLPGTYCNYTGAAYIRIDSQTIYSYVNGSGNGINICVKLELSPNLGSSNCTYYNTAPSGNVAVNLVPCNDLNYVVSSLGNVYFNNSLFMRSSSNWMCDNNFDFSCYSNLSPVSTTAFVEEVSYSQSPTPQRVSTSPQPTQPRVSTASTLPTPPPMSTTPPPTPPGMSTTPASTPPRVSPSTTPSEVSFSSAPPGVSTTPALTPSTSSIAPPNKKIMPPNFWKNIKTKTIPFKLQTVDDYCHPPVPPPTTPPYYGIVPPQIAINCSDPNISFIINQTCIVNATTSAPYATQITNITKVHIETTIKNGQLTPANVHDTGIFVYNTVTTVESLNIEGANNLLDITSIMSVQNLSILDKANKLTENSLLWFPASIHKIVNITDTDVTYNKPGANLLLHSFTLNSTVCNNQAREICYSKTSQVQSGSKDAEFCTTFNPKNLCDNNARKGYLTLWKSLSFFVLVKNNPLNIKNGTAPSTQQQQPNQTETVTFNTAPKCETGTYFKNNYGSTAGGVAGNGDQLGASTSVWVKRRDDENDLHAKIKMVAFTTDSFIDAQTDVNRGHDHYSSSCPYGTCTIVSDGNPTEPILCDNGVKRTQVVLGGAGVLVTIFSIGAYLFKSRDTSIPIISQLATFLTDIFEDKNLPKTVKTFAYFYNATFMLYSIYLLIFAEQTLASLSQDMCTGFAVAGYVLYISAIFLSIIMIMVTLNVLSCWRPGFQAILSIFTGNKFTFVPFIYSYGIPLVLTGAFAYFMTSFFKRNDGFCWIRPDYGIQSLWIPLGLLVLTLPFYILLIARRWPSSNFWSCIHGPFTNPGDIVNYEYAKIQREQQERQGSVNDGDNDDEEDDEEEEEDKEAVLTNKSLAKLVIPQILLAIPLIAENLAMYYANLTKWHYLFILAQVLQLIILNGVDFLGTAIPKFLVMMKCMKGKPKKKKKTKKSNENPPTAENGNNTKAAAKNDAAIATKNKNKSNNKKVEDNSAFDMWDTNSTNATNANNQRF